MNRSFIYWTLILVLLFLEIGCSETEKEIVSENISPVREVSDVFDFRLKGNIKSLKYGQYFGEDNKGEIVKGRLVHSYSICNFNQKGYLVNIISYDSSDNILGEKETTYDVKGYKVNKVLKKKGDLDTLIEIERYYYNKSEGILDSIIQHSELNYERNYKIVFSHNNKGQKVSEEWIPQADDYARYLISYEYNANGELEKEKVITDRRDSTIRYYTNGFLTSQDYFEDGIRTVIFDYQNSGFDSHGNYTKQICEIEYVASDRVEYDVYELNIEYW